MTPTDSTDLRPTTIKIFERYPIVELRMDQLTAPLVTRLTAQFGEDNDDMIAELRSRLLQGGAIAATVPIPVVVEESYLVIDGWLSVEAYRAISLTDGSITVPVRLFPGTNLAALEKLFEAEEGLPTRHTRKERIAALRSLHFNHPEVSREAVTPIFRLHYDVVSKVFNEIDELANCAPLVFRSDSQSCPPRAPRQRRGKTTLESPAALSPSAADLAYKQMLDTAAAHYIAHPEASLEEAATALRLPIAAVEEAREREELRSPISGDYAP